MSSGLAAVVEKPVLLVVDDEPAMADLIAIAGESAGFQVSVAHNGNEFQQQFLGNDPALIIMDVAIPDMDAVELLPWLNDAGNTAPIILISGYDYMLSWAGTMGERMGGKVIHTLCKPIKLELLDNILSEHMNDIN